MTHCSMGMKIGTKDSVFKCRVHYTSMTLTLISISEVTIDDGR